MDAFAWYLLIIALVIAFYMAWNIGANDVANSMGTSVGSGALTLKRAIIIAAIFELLGAVILGAHVTDTVRKGIVDPMAFSDNMYLFIYGMMAALLAAAVWITIATFYGLPISTSQSIVGGVAGFGIAAIILGQVSSSTLHLEVLGKIVASWIISPLVGALLAFIMFWIIKNLILDKADPVKATKKVAPFLLFLVFTVIIAAVLIKAPKGSIIYGISTESSILIAVVVGFFAFLIGYQYLFRYKPKKAKTDWEKYGRVEFIFVYLQIISACAVAFAHGSNDVANAIGPVAAIYSTLIKGAIETKTAVPIVLLILGGIGIVIGLSTWGYRVIKTIGEKIAEITPTRGFSAEFGAALTILACSLLKLPVSTSQVLVGAVIGVGFARGISAIDFRVVRNIIISWIVTIPVAAGTAIGIYLGICCFV
jgi:PiT family inorganic phosphate transporter